MLDFNLWTFNSRVFPGIDPMVARLGDRVRPEARWPEVGVDIGGARCAPSNSSRSTPVNSDATALRPVERVDGASVIGMRDPG
jgi:hypothetical protein